MELVSTNKYERLYKSFSDKYSFSFRIIWDPLVPLHPILTITSYNYHNFAEVNSNIRAFDYDLQKQMDWKTKQEISVVSIIQNFTFTYWFILRQKVKGFL